MTLWEADLDSGAIYASGDVAIGKLTDAGDHTTIGVNINGGGTIGLSQIYLMCDDGAYHGGIAGAGARVISSTVAVTIIQSAPATDVCVCDFEITATVDRTTALHFGGAAAGFTLNIRRMLIHDTTNATDAIGAINMQSSNYAQANILRNILHDITVRNLTGYLAYGIRVWNNLPTLVANNTIHHVNATSRHREAVGLYLTGTGANVQAHNNIVTDTVGDDADVDYSWGTGSHTHNLSSDWTATGTGSITLVTSADQFVSTTGGSENLHLKAGADALEAGTDLGTDDEINVDIDQDTVSGTWDMGADQLSAPTPMELTGDIVRDFSGGASTITATPVLLAVGTMQIVTAGSVTEEIRPSIKGPAVLSGLAAGAPDVTERPQITPAGDMSDTTSGASIVSQRPSIAATGSVSTLRAGANRLADRLKIVVAGAQLSQTAASSEILGGSTIAAVGVAAPMTAGLTGLQTRETISGPGQMLSGIAAAATVEAGASITGVAVTGQDRRFIATPNCGECTCP